jgi:protein TonB
VPTLEVIFSQTRTALTPKQADFLAAASQEGGGEHDRAQRRATTRPASCRRPRRG